MYKVFNRSLPPHSHLTKTIRIRVKTHQFKQISGPITVQPTFSSRSETTEEREREREWRRKIQHRHIQALQESLILHAILNTLLLSNVSFLLSYLSFLLLFIVFFSVLYFLCLQTPFSLYPLRLFNYYQVKHRINLSHYFFFDGVSLNYLISLNLFFVFCFFFFPIHFLGVKFLRFMLTFCSYVYRYIFWRSMCGLSL
jgi:hypothetical protein